MKFDAHVLPYLSGEEFSNGLRLKIAQPERSVPTRIERLERLARGRKVIHVGCVDHIPLIEQKIERGTWLHARLHGTADRCLGLDIDAEGVAYLQEKLGYEDVVQCDVIADPVPPSITAERWDVMILGEIVEHLDNPVIFLSSMREKYAAVVDRLVITVPNAFRIENFLMARRHQEFINTDHRFWFTPYTLAKVVTEAGLEVESFQFCQSYPIPKVLLPKLLLLRRYPALRDNLVLTARLTPAS